MSFQSRPDYFSLGGSNGLKLQSSDENASAQEYDAQNEKGDIVATEVYGETASPTCTYVLTSDATLSGIKMGEASAYSTSGKYYTINNITVNTAAAQAPTVTVTGMLVPSDGNCSSCYYNAPSTSIEMCHHAQDLFGLGVSSQLGSNNYLTQANYTIEGGLTTATVDGSVVSYDITGGKVTANVTVQAATSTPNLPGSSVADPWKMTSPCTRSDPDAALPTYTATFAYNLSHASAQAQQGTGTGS